MTNRAIISRGQALQILQNELRKRALEKNAAELNKATPERRSEILAQIDRDIKAEMQKRALKYYPDFILH